MPDLDVADTARLLGVSQRTVRRWLRDGRLAGYRVGRRIRIPEQSVREAVAPYGSAGSPADVSGTTDRLLSHLFDRQRLRELRWTRRGAAARLMDEIAARGKPASGPDDTAEALIRAVRDEREQKWDGVRGSDRS
jgi:excisionase family DNA binding protein